MGLSTARGMEGGGRLKSTGAGLCQTNCASVVGSGKQRASLIGHGAVEGSLVRALVREGLGW